MTTVLYVGLGDHALAAIRETLPQPEAIQFREVAQLLPDTPLHALRSGEVFLVGPYTLDPVRQIQRANHLAPALSIVVLIFPEQYTRLKQQIQFSFHIGKNVTFVPWDPARDTAGVLETAAARTRQRRSFSRIQQVHPQPVTVHAEPGVSRLDIFLDHAPIAAILFDGEMIVVSANQKAREQFPAVFSGEGRTGWNDLFPDVPLGGRQPVDPAGEVVQVGDRFLELKGSTLLVRDKPHHLLLLNDISGKVHAENRLKLKIEELEFLNREMDDFINVISHDFKTPLTSIGLLTELALMEHLEDKPREFVHQIQSSSNKLKELLNGLSQLVDIKKSRAEKLSYINFHERLQGVALEYRHLLSAQGGSITEDFTAVPGIRYFAPHLDSLLSNLITNAIKYRHLSRPVHIHASSRRDREFVVLTVRDNGMGIDLAKNMNKLFQPFKRLTDQGTGSGLGLSIVKRIIEKHQGYLEVYSTPGEGTVFHAYLKEQV